MMMLKIVAPGNENPPSFKSGSGPKTLRSLGCEDLQVRDVEEGVLLEAVVRAVFVVLVPDVLRAAVLLGSVLVQRVHRPAALDHVLALVIAAPHLAGPVAAEVDLQEEL